MAGKEGEATVNMSQAELKLIALGTRFMENGKVDYEMLAKHCGYTKGSAHVLYRKALRKLTDAYPVEGEGASETSGPDAGNGPVTPSGKAKAPPKTPKSRASGKKRKDAAGADGQDTTAITPIGDPLTPLAPGDNAILGTGDIVMETPTKKPKKAAAKQVASSFTTLKTDDDNDFFKDEPLFEPVLKFQ